MAISIHGLTALIQVYDMKRSVPFYRDILGFQVISTSHPGSDDYGWCLLRHGKAELMLNGRYENDQRPPEAEHVPSHGDITLHMGCADVDEAYTYLRDKGWDVDEPKTMHYGMRQLSLRDPDGVSLCFQHPAD